MLLVLSKRYCKQIEAVKWSVELEPVVVAVGPLIIRSEPVQAVCLRLSASFRYGFGTMDWNDWMQGDTQIVLCTRSQKLSLRDEEVFLCCTDLLYTTCKTYQNERHH